MPRIDVMQWPRLPQLQSGKRLYINYNLEAAEAEHLTDLGWNIVDVRLLDTSSLKQRQDVVLAWLEGMRQGSVEPPPRLMDFLELEARVCGLSTGKVVPEDTKKLDKRTVDAALDFKSNRAFKQAGPDALAKLAGKK